MRSTVEPNELESAQARIGNPLERNNSFDEDEVCPICKGIKPWDCKECDECYEAKEKEKYLAQ